MRLLRVLATSLLCGTFVGSAAGAELLDARETIAVPEAARFRLDLRAGWGIRDDTLATPTARISASGATLSDLVLGGGWFSPSARIGFVGRFELNRFQLRGDLAGPGALAVSATGLDALAAAAGRLRPLDGRILLEGHLGYGFLQAPLARRPGADGRVPGSAELVRGHGPTLGAHFAFAAADTLTFEVNGRAVPVTFGGRYQASAVDVRRLAIGAGASIGRLIAGDFRFSGVVGYELASTTAGGSGVEMKQLRHQIAAGIRATPHVERTVAPAVAAAPADSNLGRIRGVVRLEAAAGVGQPLAGVAVAALDGPSTTTRADGTFSLAALTPGLVRLNLARADLVPATEVVSLPADGDVTVQVALRRAQAPAPAVLIGLVRGDDGAPVAARVRLLEPGLSVDADAMGGFRFEVPAGRYTLTIEAPGFVTQRKSVRAGAGEQNIYNVDLQATR